MTITESQAQQIRAILKKEKALIRTYHTTREFKEPLMFLIRETGKIDWYENATTGEFKFTHSNGEERSIHLDNSKILKLDYGTKSIRTYIAHENFPFPLPEEPTIDATSFTISHEKTLNDIRKWKAEEYHAKATMWFYILGGIALIVAAYFLFKKPEQATQTIIQYVNTTPNLPLILPFTKLLTKKQT